MTFLEALQHPALPLLTFLLGVFLGHRTALGRDRRQEFNEACDPVRAWALREAKNPSASGPAPNIVEWDRLEQRASRRHRGRIERARQEHAQRRSEQTQPDALGQLLIVDAEPVREAARRLLEELKPR